VAACHAFATDDRRTLTTSLTGIPSAVALSGRESLSTGSIGVGQIPHRGRIVVGLPAVVATSSLELGIDMGAVDLAAGLVPQDLQAERGEQAGLQGRRQGGQDVPEEGKLVEQGRVGGGRGGLGQGGELGSDLLALVVEVGEAGANAARSRLRTGAAAAVLVRACSRSRR
jgi:hypothetical protein